MADTVVQLAPGRGADPARMPLLEHVRELRRRLGRAALGWVVGVVLSFVLYDPIFGLLERPYCGLPVSRRSVGGAACQLVFFHPMDAFTIRLRVAMIAGTLLSAPVWLFQLWRFVTPGLHRNERRWALGFAGSSTVLFGVGVTFAYLSLGKALAFLLSAVGESALPMLGIDQYLRFVTTILVVFGASFELPLLVVLLNCAGVLGSGTLRRRRRIVAFAVFAFAAVVTPSQDPFTMVALAAPLVLLYECAVVFARVNDRRRAAPALAQDGEEPC